MQIFRFHRGHSDMLLWLGRVSVLKKRVLEAWMDLLESSFTLATPVVAQAIGAAQLQASQAAHTAGDDPVVAAAAVDVQAILRNFQQQEQQ